MKHTPGPWMEAFALMREELARERAIKTDLLAACKAALDPHNYQDGRPWSELLAQVRVAVAKAEGRSDAAPR